MKGRRGNPGMKGRLVDKSVDAYVLALETINRISIQYRMEAFCYLLCNAWELLLKAKIVDCVGNPIPFTTRSSAENGNGHSRLGTA